MTLSMIAFFVADFLWCLAAFICKVSRALSFDCSSTRRQW
jgi:hypothetical protein